MTSHRIRQGSSKSDLLKETRSGTIHYQAQNDSDRTVRGRGDIAVITAKLWEKVTDSGTPFDIHVWFSDTCVRIKVGWKYVFGQSSLPSPN